MCRKIFWWNSGKCSGEYGWDCRWNFGRNWSWQWNWFNRWDFGWIHCNWIEWAQFNCNGIEWMPNPVQPLPNPSEPVRSETAPPWFTAFACIRILFAIKSSPFAFPSRMLPRSVYSKISHNVAIASRQYDNFRQKKWGKFLAAKIAICRADSLKMERFYLKLKKNLFVV